MTAAARGVDRPSSPGVATAAVVLFALAVALQVARDGRWQAGQHAEPHLQTACVSCELTPSPILRRLSLGYHALAADVYWMRTVIGYGAERRNPDEAARRYEWLAPYLSLVTTLDPDFRVAYRFGAIFLAEPSPDGPGRPDKAIALLERGLAHTPSAWEYMQDIGFINYWWLADGRTAADWFRKASAVEGAPPWLGPLAAATAAEGGNRALAREMWTRMRDEADVDWIRRSADRRLAQLTAMDRIDTLSTAVAAYVERHGLVPDTWRALVADRLLPGVPLDPSGVAFVITTDGRVDVSPDSPLSPLPPATRAAARRP